MTVIMCRTPSAGSAATPQRIVRIARPHRHRVRHVMTPPLAARLSRALVGCHPRRWRQRYAGELLEVPDHHRPTARTVLNLAASARGRGDEDVDGLLLDDGPDPRAGRLVAEDGGAHPDGEPT